MGLLRKTLLYVRLPELLVHGIMFLGLYPGSNNNLQQNSKANMKTDHDIL